MEYVHSLSDEPAIADKGLTGYSFGQLGPDLEVHYIDVVEGHDTFQISRKVTRLYYVLAGSGYFIIGGERFDVSPGLLVEVPTGVEYSYSGAMRLILISQPRWMRGNEITTGWNPDVAGSHPPLSARRSRMRRLVGFKVLGKSPVSAFLRVNRQVWNWLPGSITALSPVRWYGYRLHWLARMQNSRSQAVATFFLRNRPQLQLICRLADRKKTTGALRVAVLGCSTGAETYSIAWSIRRACPDVKLEMRGIDISRAAVKLAERGAYSAKVSQFTRTAVLERLTDAEIADLFDRRGDRMIIKPWLREGIDWRVGDVASKDLADSLGQQDIIIANNFLCHMKPDDAEKCLRNIGRLVSPGGYLVVSGVDLDVREKVARDLGWNPVEDMIEEIHNGDPVLRNQWPCNYSGLEPFDKNRSDWRLRYAAVFQISKTAEITANDVDDGEKSMSVMSPELIHTS